MSKVAESRAIAVVGIGCRLPGGVTGPDSFWDLLVGQVDAVGPIPPGRWDVERLFATDHRVPGRITMREGGFLDQVDGFDAGFFGFSRRIADQLDPQQRLLLEIAWEACEDAGIPVEDLAAARTGVFVGASSQDYAQIQTTAGEGEAMGAHAATGMSTSLLANRISHAFDLRGPSMVVDTACSSALVAVHAACQSIWAGEVDAALTGGVNLILTPGFGVALSQAGMLAADGRCKAFSAAADGFGRGEGAGLVLLKPLEDSQRDRDRIYAVIRGTAVNQDGHTPGISVPSGPAQQANLDTALRAAGVGPAEVGYVEAHGTGTPVGDPIEAAALAGVLGAGRAADRPVLVGSVKTNIGHLEAAAGIAGLIKAVLAVRHRQVPANLHFDEPNPGIDFGGLGLCVPTATTPWPEHLPTAVASVNSFGFGGTNANVVLAEAPVTTASSPAAAGNGPALLTFSARSETALRRLAAAYADRLAGPGAPGGDLESLAALLARRRSHHGHRLAVVAADIADAATKLRACADGETPPGVFAGAPTGRAAGKLAFLFNGQGPQWWAMARSLLETDGVFRSTVLRCDELARPHLDWSILDALTADEADSRVNETFCLQPAVFAVQVALAELWRTWGVTPDGVLGHSVGEYAAAYVSGALDLESAVRLICRRARVHSRADGSGGMMFVALGAEAAQKACAETGGRVCLAAENSPRGSTLSGPHDELDRVAARLDQRGVFARKLRVACPCHSPQMDPLRDELVHELAGVDGKPTTIPLYSSVLARRVDGHELDTDYWWRNFRQPVLFEGALRAVLDDGYDAFVEISPHPVLLGAVREILDDTGRTAVAVGSLVRGGDDRLRLLESLGALYAAGRAIDWKRRHPGPVPAASLPGPVWLHENYWNETAAAQARRTGGQSHPMLKRVDAARPTWEIRWDDHRLAWVRQHELFGAVIVPGAAYLEAALAAAREELGGPAALEFVDFERSCALQPDDVQIGRIELDPEDGTFELHHRSFAGDVWARTVRGRYHPEPGRGRAVDLAAVRQRCATWHARDQVYEAFTARGYVYGPAFRGMTGLHTGEGEALVELAVPAELAGTLEDYVLHPAQLDVCIQTAVLDGNARRPGDLIPVNYVPSGVDAVRVHWNGTPAYAHVLVHTRDTHALHADIAVLDAGGAVLAELIGMRGTPVPRPDSPDGAVGDHFYRMRWRSSARPAASAVTLGAQAAVAGLRPLDPAAVGDSPRYRADLRELCAAYLADCFARFGVELTAGRTITVDGLTGLLPLYRPAFDGFLRFLADAEIVTSRDDGSFQVLRDVDADHRTRWARMLTTYPHALGELRLLRKTAAHLHAVVTGATNPLELLFPDGDHGEAERFFQTSKAVRFHNEVVRQALEWVAGTATLGRTLRILEVGAGTGGLTAAVLPVLPPGRTEYVFTDISAAFTERARERFRDFPFVEHRVLDLDRDPAGQGFDPHSFDVVLASDVVHATPELRRTLASLRGLLAPGGLLVLAEVMPGRIWADLTFGLTKGWWSFTDQDVRTTGPLLDGDRWVDLLRECGFPEVAAVEDRTGNDTAPHTVLFATGPSIAEPAPPQPPPAADWIVLGDDPQLAARLAARVREHGGRALIVPAGDPVHFGDLRPARIVQLWSTGDTDAADPCRAIQDRCVELADAIRVFRDVPVERSPRLVLVSKGAHSLHGEPVRLGGASAWGIGMAARLELPHTRCVMIDLDAAGDDDLDQLWAQLCSDDDEYEIALRSGERYVRRLVRHPATAVLDRVDARTLPEDHAHALVTDHPGQLDELRWAAEPRRAPGAGEVEIEVRAVGLNFRDVLVALGRMPSTAGDRGLRMGAECAGLVTRIGQDVTGLRVGDEVVAVDATMATLASHATVNATCVALKPARLSTTQAATVPLVFLTAAIGLGRLAALRPGERVLIHSGAGGVGLAAIQLAHELGAEVLATAGSPEKRELLRSLGVAHVFDSRSLAFADEVRAATGGAGVDVVLSAVGSEATARSIACLAPYGRFVEIGQRDLRADRRLGLRPFTRNLSYSSFDLQQMIAQRPALVAEELTALLARFESGALRPLPHRVYHPSQTTAAFRHLAAGEHIGKLVLAMSEHDVPVTPLPPAGPERFAGTWLVTGGLAGIGLELACRLADAGVRHLVLVGRSGVPGPEAGEAVERLREGGVQVLAEAVDVTSASQVDTLIARIDRELPPLRGVLHCAMVIDDDPFTELDERRFREVLGPKVCGTWNLDRATADHDLDAFVLFSSTTSLLGNAGQANYAAANAFLDQFADYRAALGRPVLTVNWGAVHGAGYLTRNENAARALAASGVGHLTTDQVFEALRLLWRGSSPRVGVTKVDFGRIIRHFGLDAGHEPRYAEVLAGGGVAGPADVDGRSIVQRLRALDRDAGAELLQARIKARCAALLGVPEQEFPPDAPLTRMHMDSLLAVEIGSWIERELGVTVTTMTMMRGPSVADLTALVLDGLDLEPAPEAVAEPVRAPLPEPAAPRIEDEPVPLTELQEAYLVGRFDGLGLGGVASHAYGEYSMAELDPDRAVAAWDEIVRRHAALRMVATRGGRQCEITPTAAWQVQVDDLREDQDAAAKVAATRARMSCQVLDAYKGPLFELRLTLLPDEVRIHVSFDLLMLDAQSIFVVIHEWGVRYRGLALPPTAPAGAFLAFARDRRRRLDEINNGPDRALLARLAEELPPPPALPLALDPETVRRPEFTRRTAVLDQADWKRLRDAAAARGITVSSLFGAAFTCVVGRFSGDAPFTLGVPAFDGPQLGRSAPAIGEFTSVLLVAARPGPGAFEDYLRAFQTSMLVALEHRELGSVTVRRERSKSQGRMRMPESVAPVVFTSMLDKDIGKMDWLGRRLYGLSQTPQVWLDHQAMRWGDDAVLTWDSVDALFPAGLLDEMFDAYLSLLRGLARHRDWTADPETLSRPEPRPDPVRVAESPRLHDLVLGRAAASPDAIAIRTDERSLSYQDVAGAAGKVAAALTAAGLRPGDLVAVGVRPGWEQAPAVLGVVQAGGVYVPVDPAAPTGRIELLLRDSTARFALTTRATAGNWPAGVRLIVLEDVWTDCPATIDDPGTTSGDLAYLIYTSGSTGQPKGVAMEHGAAVNTITDINERFTVGHADRLLALTPLTFDLSVYDVFGTLSAGASLVVPGDGHRSDPKHWAGLMARHGVTMWNSVPSLLRLLTETMGEDLDWSAQLSLIMLSGDWIPVDLARRLRERLPHTRLISLGGATEAAIWSVLHDVDKVDPAWHSIPYGTAMRGQGAVVLDERLAPVPAGTPGPLFLSGAGLARGYWGDEERTRRSFPIRPATGERLYRTGDLAQAGPDGVLELLGREDQQMKIQGNRIEPGEIESALVRLAGVRDAVVGAEGARDQDRRLVAVVRPCPGSALDPVGLRAELTHELPRYLVPDLIRVVDDYPLTANGKVDRGVLFGAAPTPVGETDDVTAQVLSVLSQVLAESGLDDGDLSQIDLGAAGLTSMDLIRIANGLSSEFGSHPSLEVLYEIRSVDELVRFYAGDAAAPDRLEPQQLLLDVDAREDFKEQARSRHALSSSGIGLPSGAGPDRRRRSVREFSGSRVRLDAFGGLLDHLRQWTEDGTTRRAWGSAAGVYPVDVYVQVHSAGVSALAEGVYRYDPAQHQLVPLSDEPLVQPGHHRTSGNREAHETAGFSLFLVGDTAALDQLYGDMAEPFCLLEAGAMAHLLTTAAVGLGIDTCQIGLLDFRDAKAALGLGDSEKLLCTILGGAR
ncbi:amino acid adenylation domain-containing protein [Lentzea tibetensis]|uniref:Phenyloxazoline synthase MbtB n=1 Tax=Lentzea tibetensis TaxID=2591470 RepID=A0A563F1N2_9PSEU|nr:non-ribosomal peptide synthetase/type I polyketide synthase [Lentzea tibetensis]TWP53885.1 amino acid adenylation domain-containing protein [Lentzea tibetensis]